MEFRLATKKDTEELKELDDISAKNDAINNQKFFVLSNNDLINYYLDKKGLIIAEQDDKIIGYILTQNIEWVHGIKKVVWNEHIGTHPAYRKNGVAMKLLEFTKNYYKDKADCLYGEIHPLNEKSIRLFEKFDCEIVDRRLVFKEINS